MTVYISKGLENKGVSGISKSNATLRLQFYSTCHTHSTPHTLPEIVGHGR